MTDQTRMSDERLLPCPFCGEQPEPPVFVDDAYYSISCSDCSGRVPYGTSEQDAKTQWNMRSHKALEQSQARVVELEKELAFQVTLPKLTPDLINRWRGPLYLLQFDLGGGVEWTQDAVDFACVLVGKEDPKVSSDE